MSDPFESTHPTEIASFVGKHIIYTYANGWPYEMNFKNERMIDYRVHGGMVGGRWVKGQEVHIVRLADGVYKVSWNEPTGTCVSVAYNLNENRAHGATFFPRWIELQPERIIGFQIEKIGLMREYRDAGPDLPDPRRRRICRDHFRGRLRPSSPARRRICPPVTPPGGM